jgi:tRNA (cytidine/uridine-2'-O-)-methyltransferase
MFEIVLFEPEIPPNTGNVIRLCANAGCRLHVVHPLGFSLRDRELRRAGLDYHALTEIVAHADWKACRAALAARRLFAVTTRCDTRYTDVQYEAGDGFVFGPETRGLPAEVLEEFAPERRVRVPMSRDGRSLNLSNAVAVVVYEAWRQAGFAGGR